MLSYFILFRLDPLVAVCGPATIQRYYSRLLAGRRQPWVIMLTIVLSQDLKDFGREAGSVSYADIDRDRPGEG